MVNAPLASQWIYKIEVAIAFHIIINLTDGYPCQADSHDAKRSAPTCGNHSDPESVVFAPNPVSAIFIYVSDYIIQWNHM